MQDKCPSSKIDRLLCSAGNFNIQICIFLYWVKVFAKTCRDIVHSRNLYELKAFANLCESIVEHRLKPSF